MVRKYTVEDGERYDAADQDKRQSTQRPSEPCSDAVAPPTNFSIRFACHVRHDPILQHYRLLSVTAAVTRWSGERTSENPVKGKFGKRHIPGPNGLGPPER